MDLTSTDVRTNGIFNEEISRHAWIKINLRILPVVAMFFLLSFLDRTNLGNARIAGLQTYLGISDYYYAIAITATFIPYILVEIPANLLLKKIGPDIFLPTLLTCWGIVTILQGFVRSYYQLVILRFLLGTFEGGVTPGLVLYLSTLYPRQKLSLRVAVFFSTASLASAFSGILAYNIIKMDGKGGRPGWAWIFILEGSFTLLFGASSFALIPRSIEHCKFLSTAEKQCILKELRNTNSIGDAEDDKISAAEVRRAFCSLHVIIVAVITFFAGTIGFGLAYFTPSIVHGLGYTAARAQLFSAPPFMVAFFVCLTCAYLSDRYNYRSLIVIFAGITCTIGFVSYLSFQSFNKKYMSLFLSISGAFCVIPALSSWVANNSAPHARRATATAFMFQMGNVGGILSAWLLGILSPPPLYTDACITLLAFSLLMIVLTILNVLYLSKKNSEKAAILEWIMANGQLERTEGRRLDDKSPLFRYSL